MSIAVSGLRGGNCKKKNKPKTTRAKTTKPLSSILGGKALSLSLSMMELVDSWANPG